jgi:hypothetical protein
MNDNRPTPKARLETVRQWLTTALLLVIAGCAVQTVQEIRQLQKIICDERDVFDRESCPR